MVPQSLPAAENAAETDLTHLHVTAATFNLIFLTGRLGTGLALILCEVQLLYAS